MRKTLTDEQAKTAQAFILAVEALPGLVRPQIVKFMIDEWDIEHPEGALDDLLEAVE